MRSSSPSMSLRSKPPMYSASFVFSIIHVTRRRSDVDESREAFRFLDRGEHADHGADGVPHEDYVTQVEGRQDVEDVLRVAMQAVIAVLVEGRPVGFPTADVVEHHNTIIALERRCDPSPHRLVAPEAMRKKHDALTTARKAHIVTRANVLGVRRRARLGSNSRRSNHDRNDTRCNLSFLTRKGFWAPRRHRCTQTDPSLERDLLHCECNYLQTELEFCCIAFGCCLGTADDVSSLALGTHRRLRG